ncbi:MAG: hypothetical protein IH969_05670 [Candidatus Krumholzibacteriota bacterium]|nr:hypothetical protein [Candidatus Krumholzibacteriota bacterium]
MIILLALQLDEEAERFFEYCRLFAVNLGLTIKNESMEERADTAIRAYQFHAVASRLGHDMFSTQSDEHEFLNLLFSYLPESSSRYNNYLDMLMLYAMHEHKENVLVNKVFDHVCGEWSLPEVSPVLAKRAIQLWNATASATSRAIVSL